MRDLDADFGSGRPFMSLSRWHLGQIVLRLVGI